VDLMAKFKKGDYVIRVPEKDCPLHQESDDWEYGLESYNDFAPGTILKVTRPFIKRFWAKYLKIDSMPWFRPILYTNLDCKAFRKISKAEVISHML
jgi:hypothetical protein